MEIKTPKDVKKKKKKKNHSSLPGFGTGMTCPSGAWAEHIAVADPRTAWTWGHASPSWPKFWKFLAIQWV